MRPTHNHGERHRDQGLVPLGDEGVLRQDALQIVVDGLKGFGEGLPFIVDGLAVRIQQKVGQLVSVVLRRRAARGPRRQRRRQSILFDGRPPKLVAYPWHSLWDVTVAGEFPRR